MTQLHDLTAVEQRDALRRREIKSVELTDHYLERIDRHGEALGAFATLTSELAREEAARADDLLAAGDVDGRPLLGLPIAFKDLFAVAGVPLTQCSAAIETVVPEADSWTVGLIRQAGTVTLGTTRAPELGIPCYTEGAVNPYDTTRCPSGSSGGTAAAVAAGLLPVGHGSDGAGSVRLPAAVCGLVGVKPTRGRVSPASPSFLGWITEGPLTRTIADAALLLDVMAQPSAADLHRRPSVSPHEPRPLTIAAWTDHGLSEPDPEVLAAVVETSVLLQDAGHTVVHVPNPVPWTDELAEGLAVIFGGWSTRLCKRWCRPTGVTGCRTSHDGAPTEVPGSAWPSTSPRRRDSPRSQQVSSPLSSPTTPC